MKEMDNHQDHKVNRDSKEIIGVNIFLTDKSKFSTVKIKKSEIIFTSSFQSTNKRRQNDYLGFLCFFLKLKKVNKCTHAHTHTHSLILSPWYW